MNHEKFKNISSGIQSAAFSVAIVVGGIWTLATFNALHQADLARGEYEKLQREIQEQRAVEIRLVTTVTRIPEKSARLIVVTAEFYNSGHDTEFFYWSESLFTVSKLIVNDEGISIGKSIEGLRLERYSGEDHGMLLSPGETNRRMFVAMVREPGFFFIKVEVNSSQQAQKTFQEKGIDTVESAAWSGVSHIVVE